MHRPLGRTSINLRTYVHRNIHLRKREIVSQNRHFMAHESRIFAHKRILGRKYRGIRGFLKSKKQGIANNRKSTCQFAAILKDCNVHLVPQYFSTEPLLRQTTENAALYIKPQLNHDVSVIPHIV